MSTRGRGEVEKRRVRNWKSSAQEVSPEWKNLSFPHCLFLGRRCWRRKTAAGANAREDRSGKVAQVEFWSGRFLERAGRFRECRWEQEGPEVGRGLKQGPGKKGVVRNLASVKKDRGWIKRWRRKVAAGVKSSWVYFGTNGKSRESRF